MNKEVIILISNRLKSQVPAIKWIDIDTGQLDILTQRPPVAFPACLVDLTYPQCDDTGEHIQIVTANVILRLAFDFTGATNSASPVRETSLGFLDVIEAVHEALQGWSNSALSSFSRINAQPERRKDGLKVYRITYQTAFSETTGIS
ncbi:MAG: hypothetical protein BWX87_00666 [Bacteroidetes bacterium ADurb.Bin123]|jgi:hypothetical protein|nr:MAG: hypothetical protein BWX87_00666 [Bacteroidetes bacterium ADurb.Bin123]